jgi:phenylacetate-CoA ligase
MSAPVTDRLRDGVRSRYARMPSATQDLLCSAYGFQELVRRRGSPLRAARRRDAIEELHHDRVRAEAVVDRRLRIILDKARALPGYPAAPRSAAGMDPRDELLRWPLLTKQDIRGRTTAFLTREPVASDVKSLTSGTTGTPVLVWRPRAAFQELFLSGEQVKRWFGLSGVPRRASFTGHTVVSQDSKRVWRLNAPGKQLVLSQYHLQDEAVHDYYAALARWQPEMLDGYMSNLVDLASRLEAAGLELEVPLIVPSSEVLGEPGRRMLERVFGARVSDKYGMSENLAYACECPSGSRHVFENIGVIEVLDESGRPVADGDVGRLVVTTLTNGLMPLVRYDIGDLGSLVTDHDCPCGRTSPVLRDLVGRADDVIVTADGRRIAIFAFNLVRGITEILAVQVVQRSPHRFLVRVAVDPAWSGNRSTTEQRLLVAFDRLIGRDPEREVVFDYDTPLERTPGGKIRNVIREDGSPRRG